MLDFLVIGGGIAGLSTAARLSALGSVMVLEAEQAVGYHASGRSAALFAANYGSPSTCALNSASRDWHLTVNGSQDLPRGFMLLGSQETEDAFKHDLEDMKLQEISLTQATELLPILNKEHVTRAAYISDVYDIDTDSALQKFLRILRDNGGELRTNSQVTKITKNKHWIVEAGETYEARNLVNAAGAWADVIAELASIPPIGFTPCRRSVARVAAPEGINPAKWPMLVGPAESWYAKPDAGALIISPADQTPTSPHDAWADDETLAIGIDSYQKHVTEPVMRMLSNWAGLRTFSPDKQLVLGPDPLDPSFIWSAGQGGNGFCASPAASQFVADLLADRPSDLDKPTQAALRPDRFRD